MKKTLTGILLATSVLAMAAVQPVSAASTETGTSSTGAQSTSSFKEIHFVTFQMVDQLISKQRLQEQQHLIQVIQLLITICTLLAG